MADGGCGRGMRTRDADAGCGRGMRTRDADGGCGWGMREMRDVRCGNGGPPVLPETGRPSRCG
ncbi:MAG: hypothetical protein FWG40_00005 [Peptococcaceae bacterium]|nr:hypothetical protein [Peptococcaceae bacterium]